MGEVHVCPETEGLRAMVNAHLIYGDIWSHRHPPAPSPNKPVTWILLEVAVSTTTLSKSVVVANGANFTSRLSCILSYT